MISLAVLVLTLAAREPSPPLLTRGFAARAAALDAVEHRSLFPGVDGRYRTAGLLVKISFGESRWDPFVISKDGLDCGHMQIRKFHIGGSCDRVLGRLDVGFSIALDLLEAFLVRCGTVRRAVSAYASGSCEASPAVTRIVDDYCEGAGGC